MPNNELTRFQYDLLAVLHAHGAEYGLGILDELEERSSEEISHPRLYTNLNDLVDAGLVGKSERDKRTNEYALTQQGRMVLRERVRELGGEPDE